jgi:acetyl esterase/lipase
LPPLLIQAGTHELLLDDIRKFVSKLKLQKGTVQYQEWEGMFHCWHIFASEVSEGQKTIRAIGEFTRKIWNR